MKIFQQLQDYASFAANIATIFGCISVIIAVFSFSRNRLRKKSFRLKINNIEDYYGNSKFFLSLQNFTDKTLYIIEIKLIIKNCCYSASDLYYIFQNIVDYKKLKNIPISPFEATDINCFFEIPQNSIPIKFKLKIVTTQKTLSYKFSNIFRNCDSNSKTNPESD